MGGAKNRLEGRARTAQAEAELPVAGKEGRGKVVWVERNEGARRLKSGLFGRNADTQGRDSGLNLEDVGDRVRKRDDDGVELGSKGEGFQSRGTSSSVTSGADEGGKYSMARSVRLGWVGDYSRIPS